LFAARPSLAPEIAENRPPGFGNGAAFFAISARRRTRTVRRARRPSATKQTRPYRAP
jgi:hypothetical protein